MAGEELKSLEDNFSSSLVVGAKKPTGKAVSTKKVSAQAFDDWDNWEEKEEEEVEVATNGAPAKPGDREKIFSHTSNRLAYVEDEGKGSNKGNGEDGGYVSYSGRPAQPKGKAPVAAEQPAASLQKYANAKSISSTQLFGDEGTKVSKEESQQQLNRFQGANSISSADYFGKQEDEDVSAGGLAWKLAAATTTDFTQIKSAVYDGGKRITDIASGLLTDLQERYG